MFVVLNVGYGLIEVAVWADSARYEAVLDLAEELIEHRDAVFADDNSFGDFRHFDLAKPLVALDLSDGQPLGRVSIQNFLD